MAVQAVTMTRPVNSKFRWVIWVFMLFGVALSIADRGIIGIIAPDLMKVFHLNVVQYGIVASAFGWGYTPFVFLGGVLIYRLGVKRLWLWSMALWALFLGLTPLASSFGILLLVRLFFGAAEGAGFPSTGRLVGSWYPVHERAIAKSVDGLGAVVGNIIMIPATAVLATAVSWQSPFFLLVALGAVWIILAAIYLSALPSENHRVSTSELEYIHKGLPVSEEKAKEISRRIGWGRILSNGSIWGAGIAGFAVAWMFYFALTFMPLYFVQGLHVTELGLAEKATLPWIGFGVGVLVGSRLSDKVYQVTKKLRIARSYLIAGELLVATILLLAVTHVSASVALVLLPIDMFFVGMAHPLYVVLGVDLCPVEPARTSGFVIGVSSIPGIIAPLVIGFTVGATHSYFDAFLVSAGVLFLGVLSALGLVFPDRQAIID